MSLTRRPLFACLLFSLAPPGVFAQSLNLRDLLTDFLRNGITLAPPATGFSHSAHFIAQDSLQFQALTAFTNQVAAQLSTFPIASSAGGFTYRFDPDLGVLVRTTDSFGPVYTERAETIGKGRFNLGINYSSFTFDRIDGLSLPNGDLKLVFTHQPIGAALGQPPFFFEGDVITTDLRLRLTSNITAFVLTYGVLDQLDFGLAVPVEDVEMKAVSNAVIQRLATGVAAPTIHQFVGGGSTAVISQNGSASGLGDILARAKFRVLRGPSGALAIFADVRVPTGDDANLLGIGTTQVKGAVAGSLHFSPVSLHANGGYTWTAEKNGVKTVPDQINYNFGIDVAAHPRLTVAAEFIGQTLRNAEKIVVEDHTYTAQQLQTDQTFKTVTAVFPRLVVAPVSSQTRLTGSVGLKINPVGNLLLTLNGLFPLNNVGLQDKFTPFVGLDYSF